MRHTGTRRDQAKRNIHALLLAVLLLASIVVGLSCGEGDLGLPGSPRPTSVPTATATEDPDEN